MRASNIDTHVGGAEHIVNGHCINNVLTEAIWRGITSYVTPTEIIVTIEAINPDSVINIKSLDIRTINSSSSKEAYRLSKEILESNGISSKAIENTFQLLQTGPTPEGSNMRGAIILDALTGHRLEPDMRRGVRVSRIDYAKEARMILENMLKEYGIYHSRVLDALAIATKVSNRKETIAELCWSDNPDYTTGYIASKKSGYVRITNIKGRGVLRGGRVFFVNPEELYLNQYVNYLEKQPVIINSIGKIYVP